MFTLTLIAIAIFIGSFVTWSIIDFLHQGKESFLYKNVGPVATAYDAWKNVKANEAVIFFGEFNKKTPDKKNKENGELICKVSYPMFIRQLKTFKLVSLHDHGKHLKGLDSVEQLDKQIEVLQAIKDELLAVIERIEEQRIDACNIHFEGLKQGFEKGKSKGFIETAWKDEQRAVQRISYLSPRMNTQEDSERYFERPTSRN
jgi:flagellar biosynthesis/type III secretory pathway protein FliH